MLGFPYTSHLQLFSSSSAILGVARGLSALQGALKQVCIFYEKNIFPTLTRFFALIFLIFTCIKTLPCKSCHQSCPPAMWHCSSGLACARHMTPKACCSVVAALRASAAVSWWECPRYWTHCRGQSLRATRSSRVNSGLWVFSGRFKYSAVVAWCCARCSLLFWYCFCLHSVWCRLVALLISDLHNLPTVFPTIYSSLQGFAA